MGCLSLWKYRDVLGILAGSSSSSQTLKSIITIEKIWYLVATKLQTGMYGCYLATCEASLTAKSPYLPHGKPPCTFESLLGRYFHMESIKFPDPVQIDTDGICKKRIWSSESGAVWHNALLIGFLMFEQRPFHVCSILRHQPWCSVKWGLICSAVLMCLSISALVHEQHMNFSTLVVSIAASIAACNGSLHSRLRASHGVSLHETRPSLFAPFSRIQSSKLVKPLLNGLGKLDSPSSRSRKFDTWWLQNSKQKCMAAT